MDWFTVNIFLVELGFVFSDVTGLIEVTLAEVALRLSLSKPLFGLYVGRKIVTKYLLGLLEQFLVTLDYRQAGDPSSHPFG